MELPPFLCLLFFRIQMPRSSRRHKLVSVPISLRKHGIGAIEKVRKESPSKYLALVAHMVPREAAVTISHDFTSLLEVASRQLRAEAVRQVTVDQIEAVPDPDENLTLEHEAKDS